MRRLPIFILVLLFIVYFCAGFTIVFKSMTFYIEKKGTKSFEDNPYSNYVVLAFTTDDVHIITLDKLEDFKREKPEYSFLVPKDQENHFAQMLEDRRKETTYEIEVDQISDNRQLLTISAADIITIDRNTYEATDKEIFPKTSMLLNFRQTPLKILVSLIGGAITCFIFLFIYKKFITV